MPRRYGPDGTALWNGKAPEEFSEADVYRFMAETEEVLQKRELLGGESDARSIAQRLAEGRTQAVRDNAARPARAAVKESGTTRNYWDVPLPLPELWEAVKWAVKPNGAVLFFAQCPYDKVLGASNLSMLRYEWVWYKERGTGFLNANRAPLKKSENILVFYQKSPIYHPQFTYGEPYRRVYSHSGSSTNYGAFERVGTKSSDGRRYPGNVLFVPTVMCGIHPTQKPVELCEYFIKTYTDEGAVIADICAGSGTTAVAALHTGRRFICFENAPAIYGPAIQRIEQARLAVERGGKGV